MAKIHPRMPVILHALDYDRWLDREETERLPIDLLRPFESEEMEVYEANPKVGNVRNNGPEMLAPDGLMHLGKFVQVEIMRKDAKRYKGQEGSGWGRWRGMDLKPYGTDARFVGECTGYHQPVKGDDYVYTMPITATKIARQEVVNNRAAMLPPSLPYHPLAWSLITMYVDPKTHTMATLFGNNSAAVAATTRGSGKVSYPTGSVLAFVTWVQRDDPHWFGARIPDSPQSVEFVEVGDSKPSYRRFDGRELAEDHGTPAVASQRATFVMGLSPAQLP